MDFDQLTDEQIRNLTPEQITEIEKNPEAIDKYLADQKEATETSEDEPEQEEDSQETDEDIAANGEGEDEEDEKEPVVLTKNGKGTIPYEKHKELRVENATLKQQLEDLKKAQADLKSLAEKKESARTPERRAEIQKRLADRIAKAKEDFPDVGDPLSDISDLITDLSAELAEEKANNRAKAEKAEAEKKRQEEEQQRVINEKVQEAKENNPDLVYWEEHDEDAWKEAMLQDQVLLQNPKWANKSYEERFVEVVKRVRAVMPEATEPPNAEPSAKTKEKAKAKLEKAPAKKPTTLSDIKGGGNPISEKEQLENLHPHELARKLMQMPAHKAAAMRSELD